MFLVHPTPVTKAWLDTRFLFDLGDVPQGYPAFEPCIIVSVKTRLGYDLEFQVLTERGMLRDKLPVCALRSTEVPVYSELTQRALQRWTCGANYLSIYTLPLTTGKAWLAGTRVPFIYHFTVDFVHTGPELDLGDSMLPEEHKAMHFLELPATQQFCLGPNNSLVWDHSTLVPQDKQLDSNPGYRVATHSWSVDMWRCAKPSVARNEQLYDTGVHKAYDTEGNKT